MRVSSFPIAPTHPGTRVPGTVAARYRGLGFDPFTAIAGIGGSLITGLFGSSEADKQRELQSQAMWIQAYLQRGEVQAAKSLAEAQLAAIDKNTEAQVRIADLQNRAQLQALESQARTVLEAQAAQSAAQRAAFSAELASNTQRGIFDLAVGGIEQTGSVARQYPRSGTTAVAMIVGGVLLASVMLRKKPKKRKKVAA